MPEPLRREASPPLPLGTPGEPSFDLLYFHFALGSASPILTYPNSVLKNKWTWTLRWTRTFARDIARIYREPEVMAEMCKHPECYIWAIRQLSRLAWVAPEATRRMSEEELEAFTAWGIYQETKVDWVDWNQGREVFNRRVLARYRMGELFL